MTDRDTLNARFALAQFSLRFVVGGESIIGIPAECTVMHQPLIEIDYQADFSAYPLF